MIYPDNTCNQGVVCEVNFKKFLLSKMRKKKKKKCNWNWFVILRLDSKKCNG